MHTPCTMKTCTFCYVFGLSILYFVNVVHSTFLFNGIANPLKLIDSEKNKIIQSNPITKRIQDIIKSVSPCYCAEFGCLCNFKLITNNLMQVQSGTLGIKFNGISEAELSFKIGSLEKKVTFPLATSRIQNPSICLPCPYIPGLIFCGTLYDIQLTDSGLHVCAKVEANYLIVTLGTIAFDCIIISKNAIGLVESTDNSSSPVVLYIGKKPTITIINKKFTMPVPVIG